MIKLSSINKIYHTPTHSLHALKDINLNVAPGEIVGVIGKSGAGKSTLIRCVNLLERPTSGSVFVNGLELTALSQNQLRQARHQIGMIFQHFNLLSTRTVFDNVAFPLQLLKKSKSEIEQCVLPLLEKVGLSEKRDDYPSQLSGGQKQRVAIARALSTKPAVLLCDEMTSALDPYTTEDILKLLREINREMQLSILCITHEMSVVKSIADRVAVIDQGEIIECSNVVEIFKNPQQAITKKLIEPILKSELPHDLQSQLRSHPAASDHVVICIGFFGETTLEPILNELVTVFKIKVNVLQANMERLRKKMIGRMIIALDFEEKIFDKILSWLRQKELQVEVMGYVDEQAWIN